MNNWCQGTGKKKKSIARVFIKQDKNEILINNKLPEHYFPKNFQYKLIFFPLNLTQTKFNLMIKVKGGGLMSQIYAIKYGIAKAIANYEPKYKILLSQYKLLTRDSRKVERKKLGKKKARKAKQFSKR